MINLPNYIDHVLQWLGSVDGLAFIARCENLIKIRQKGLTDRDLINLGLTLVT